jgi:hypothetical protein
MFWGVKALAASFDYVWREGNEYLFSQLRRDVGLDKPLIMFRAQANSKNLVTAVPERTTIEVLVFDRAGRADPEIGRLPDPARHYAGGGVNTRSVGSYHRCPHYLCPAFRQERGVETKEGVLVDDLFYGNQ